MANADFLLLTRACFQIGLLSVTQPSEPVFLARLHPSRGSSGNHGDKTLLDHAWHGIDGMIFFATCMYKLVSVGYKY